MRCRGMLAAHLEAVSGCLETGLRALKTGIDAFGRRRSDRTRALGLGRAAHARALPRHARARPTATRDRALLVRYYLHDEDKRVICRELGLSEPSFNVVLFRARARFLELLQKHGLQGRDLMSFILL